MLWRLMQRQAGNTTGQESPTSSAERVLTLSVPSGQERSLTGSDIKRMSWPEYTFLYEVWYMRLFQLPVRVHICTLQCALTLPTASVLVLTRTALLPSGVQLCHTMREVPLRRLY